MMCVVKGHMWWVLCVCEMIVRSLVHHSCVPFRNFPFLSARDRTHCCCDCHQDRVLKPKRNAQERERERECMWVCESVSVRLCVCVWQCYWVHWQRMNLASAFSNSLSFLSSPLPLLSLLPLCLFFHFVFALSPLLFLIPLTTGADTSYTEICKHNK